MNEKPTRTSSSDRPEPEAPTERDTPGQRAPRYPDWRPEESSRASSRIERPRGDERPTAEAEAEAEDRKREARDRGQPPREIVDRTRDYASRGSRSHASRPVSPRR